MAADDRPPSQQGSNYAFVTLLYSNFVHGTRALARSLHDSKTIADVIVLVTPDVSDSTRRTLACEGCIVRPVEVEPNPNQNFLSRLVHVYTKLQIFGMTEYDRIVFLDSDTLVLENVDELFLCEPFCAVMRHSELLNSGVLVLTPSRPLHDDMRSKFGLLDSYTGGDQGFLNSYYPGFAASPLFEPFAPPPPPPPPPPPLPTLGDGALPGDAGGAAAGTARAQSWRSLVGPAAAASAMGGGDASAVAVSAATGGVVVGGDGLDLRCKRLPTRYNGDWPLLFVDGDIQAAQRLDGAPSDWQRRKRVRILHFTFGAAKPWHWWARPFLPYVGRWRRIQLRVLAAAARRAAPGHGDGGVFVGSAGAYDAPLVGALATPLVAAAVLLLLAWRSGPCRSAAAAAARRVAAPLVPACALRSGSLAGAAFNLVVGVASLGAALVLGFAAVPDGLSVRRSWFLFSVTSTTALAALHAAYLAAVSAKAE
ncbi:unnamed protein product, partial [Phaeothamnion confervicola]